MLYWAAVFFVIALIGAVLGFSGIAAGAAGIAKILFFVFLVLGALSLIFGRRVPACVGWQIDGHAALRDADEG